MYSRRPYGSLPYDSVRLQASAAVAGPSVNYDQPNPRGPVHSVTLRSWVLASPLALLAATASAPPHANYDQPNPRAAPFAVSLRTHIDPTKRQLIGKDQFFGVAGNPNEDWSNPRGAAYPSDLRTFTQAPSLALTSVAPPPRCLFDWTLPRAASPAVELRTWLQTSAFLSVEVLPPGAVSLPEPRGPVYPTSLRTHLDPLKLELLGQDRFFGVAGNPNEDWSNPRGPQFASDLRTWTQSTAITLRVAAGAPPPTNYDQPNPQQPRYAIALRTHIDPLKLELLGQDQFYGAPGQPPTYDQPLPPRGAAYPVALRTWSAVAPPATPQAPFGQSDWLNPRAPPRSFDLLTWSNGLPPPVPAPFAQSDWLNPRAPARSLDLLTWSNGLPPPFAPFAQTDWPNPRGATPAIVLRWWSNSFIPPPPGKPTVPIDWTNPVRAVLLPAPGWTQVIPLTLMPSHVPSAFLRHLTVQGVDQDIVAVDPNIKA